MPCPAGALAVCITEPAHGAEIDADRVNVKGTYAGPENSGIVVNGVLALASGGRFIANAVHLDAGQNDITAIITSPEGGTAQHSVTVVATGGKPAVTLTGEPVLALAPMTANLTYEADPALDVASLALDFEGDGTDDATLQPGVLPPHLYAAPGLYVPRLTVTDRDGATYTAETGVQAVDPAQLDTLLKKIWDDMKSATARGDFDSAVAGITIVARDSYHQALGSLDPNAPSIQEILPEILSVQVRDDRAEYQMLRPEGAGSISHFVLFERDDDGVWRLKFF
jgi:hypothetical protein